jgi:hypothetical protein
VADYWGGVVSRAVVWASRRVAVLVGALAVLTVTGCDGPSPVAPLPTYRYQPPADSAAVAARPVGLSALVADLPTPLRQAATCTPGGTMPWQGISFTCTVPTGSPLAAGLAANDGPAPLRPFFAYIDKTPGFTDYLHRNHAPYGPIVEDDEKLIFLKCPTEPFEDATLFYLNTRSGLEISVRHLVSCAAAKAFLTRAGL